LTDIAFYHLEKWPLERALPMLLEKTLKAGKRALVLAGSEARVEALNAMLWTYDQDSWLPHGSAADGEARDQPVWLDIAPEGSDGGNLNGAQYLFLTDGATSGRVADFERCFELFDGRDQGAVEAARGRWKDYKAAGHALTYWRQTDAGGWQKQET
jgi:DNA polymerase-3 subunit chi